MTKKIYIIGNWKMNPATLSEAEKLFDKINQGVIKLPTEKARIVICPPFVWLPLLKSKVESRESRVIGLGAQDVFYKETGAYTGEISPLMLKDLGVEYVIIGHSERRKFLKEKDEMLNKKIRAVLKVGLRPIFCVGNEKLTRPQNVQELNRIKTQLSKGLKGIGLGQIQRVTIAYEPVWAISPNPPATPHYATSIIRKIRQRLCKIYNQKIANDISVLYGGSVEAADAPLFTVKKEIDGVLVGGASLDAQKFVGIVENIGKL